jgi:hypothetical protein
MVHSRNVSLTLASGLWFVVPTLAAEGTSLKTLNDALAEAKSSGKPLLVVGGAPER